MLSQEQRLGSRAGRKEPCCDLSRACEHDGPSGTEFAGRGAKAAMRPEAAHKDKGAGCCTA